MDWFLPPAAGLSTTLAMQKPFLIYFQSVICSHHSGNWQSTIVLLIKTKKKPTSLCVFPLSSHSLFMDCPLDSARRKSSGLKRDRTSNCTHSAIVFQSVGSCGVLADCLLRKSLGCNRKTQCSMASLLYSMRVSGKENWEGSPVFLHLKGAEHFCGGSNFCS